MRITFATVGFAFLASALMGAMGHAQSLEPRVSPKVNGSFLQEFVAEGSPCTSIGGVLPGTGCKLDGLKVNEVALIQSDAKGSGSAQYALKITTDKLTLRLGCSAERCPSALPLMAGCERMASLSQHHGSSLSFGISFLKPSDAGADAQEIAVMQKLLAQNQQEIVVYLGNPYIQSAHCSLK